MAALLRLPLGSMFRPEQRTGPMTQLPGWLLLNVAALGSCLAHTFVDQHLGLYGKTSSSMSLLQATAIVLTCLVVACWILCLASATAAPRAGLSGAAVLAVLWAFLANGAAAAVVAPPPADAFPFQDLVHLSSTAFGGLAAIATWRELKRTATPWNWVWSVGTTAVLIGLFVTQSVLSQPNL